LWNFRSVSGLYSFDLFLDNSGIDVSNLNKLIISLYNQFVIQKPIKVFSSSGNEFGASGLSYSLPTTPIDYVGQLKNVSNLIITGATNTYVPTPTPGSNVFQSNMIYLIILIIIIAMVGAAFLFIKRRS
jgi:hypothetical protein